MSYTIEVHRRVYDDSAGTCIQVGPDADSLNLVHVTTEHSKDSAEYWGKIRLTLHPEMARKLAHAILACANECEVQDKKDTNDSLRKT